MTARPTPVELLLDKHRAVKAEAYALREWVFAQMHRTALAYPNSLVIINVTPDVDYDSTLRNCVTILLDKPRDGLPAGTRKPVKSWRQAVCDYVRTDEYDRYTSYELLDPSQHPSLDVDARLVRFLLQETSPVLWPYEVSFSALPRWANRYGEYCKLMFEEEITCFVGASTNMEMIVW